MAITDKQEMFCCEHLIDLNATQAAISTGGSVNAANRTVPENPLMPDTENRIEQFNKVSNP